MSLRDLDWEITSVNYWNGTKLRDLILNVYEKSSIRKMWWLVRHSAGMLGMTSDELAKVSKMGFTKMQTLIKILER